MNNALKNIILTGVLLLCLVPETVGQSGTYYTVRDLEAWSAVEFKYKYNKQWSFYLEEQLRLKNDISSVDQYFSELGLTYKFNKHVAFGVAGRWIRENDDVGKIQGYENHFRWNTDISYKHNVDEFSFKYRLRYQSKDELGITVAEGDDLKNTFRFKFDTDYNFKKWKLDPEFSSEIFNSIQPADGFDKIRLSLGTTYETKKLGDFSAFYRIEKDLIGLYPKTTNIIGLKYSYTLKRTTNEK